MSLLGPLRGPLRGPQRGPTIQFWEGESEPPPPDIIAPVISSATGTQTGTTTASLSCATNETNGTMYVSVTTSASPPTAANIIAGTGATYFSNALASSSPIGFSATGLTHSTTYYAHFVQRDAALNTSNIATSASFTTAVIDVTAPVLSSPTGTQTGTTTANIGVTTNEANGILYASVTTSATPPSAAAVKLGTGAVFASSQAIGSTGAKTFGATGLTASTVYYAYFMHEDSSSNQSTVSAASSFTTAATPDTTAPVLTSPTGTQTGGSTASLTVVTDEANGTLYAAVQTSSTPPSSASIIAGTGFAYAGNQAIGSTGTKNFSATGLSSGITYYAYFVHRDAALNISNVAASSSFTTASVDTTAPVLTSPTAAQTSDTTALIGVTTDTAEGTMYAVVTTSATTPSKAQVKLGQNHASAAATYAGNLAISSTGAKAFNVTGLTVAVTYYAYFMHEDVLINQSTVSAASSFTTVDTTAPILTLPSGTATGDTTANLAVTTNEANGTLYSVVTTSATEPNAAQIKLGQNHLGAAAVFADDQSIGSTGIKTFSATGLVAATTYYAYFTHEDAATNLSIVAASASFLTTGGAALDYFPQGYFDTDYFGREYFGWSAASTSIAADWYVDGSVGSSGVGTTAGTAFKTIQEGVNAASAGDTIAVLGHGRTIPYRASVTLGVSGTSGNPIILVGYGDDPVIIDGGELTTGWTACVNAADAGGNANWANMYRTTIPSSITSDPLCYNLRQAGVGMYLPVRGAPGTFNTLDKLFNPKNHTDYDTGDSYTFTTLTDIAGILHTAYSTNSDLDNGYALLHNATNNIALVRKISAFNAATDVMTFATVPATPGFPLVPIIDATYAILNVTNDITMAGQWSFKYATEGDGSRVVWCWPHSSADMTNIEVTQRKFGLDLNGQDYWSISNIEVHGTGGVGQSDGHGIGEYSGSVSHDGIIIEDCRVENTVNFYPDSGGGTGILVSGTLNQNIIVRNCETYRTQNAIGIQASGNNVRIYGNLVDWAGFSALRAVVIRNSLVYDNTVTNVFGSHANGMTCNGVSGADSITYNYRNVFAFNTVRSDQGIGMVYQVGTDELFFCNDVQSPLGSGGRGIENNSSSSTPVIVVGTISNLNNTSGPSPTVVLATSSQAMAFGRGPQTTHNAVNNVAHGGVDYYQVTNGTGAVKGQFSHNVLTGKLGLQSITDAFFVTDQNSYRTTVANVFNAYTDEDYTPVSGGPLDGTGDNITALLAPWRALFPDFDFDRDITGAAVDWATDPFIGAYKPSPLAYDRTPAFTFTDKTNQVLGAGGIASVAAQVTGFTGQLWAEITGGTAANKQLKILDIDGSTLIDDWRSGPALIEPDQYILVRGDASGSYATETTVIATIGNTSDTFSITTQSSFAENYVTFGGSAGLTRTADLDSAADGRTGLFFAAVTFANTASATEGLFCLNSATSQIIRTATGNIRWGMLSADATQQIGLVSGSTVITAEKCLVCLAVNADGTTYCWVWHDGVWTLDASDAVGGTRDVDWTRGNWNVACGAAGATKLVGTAARFAFWQNPTLGDFSTKAILIANFADEATGTLLDPLVSQATWGTPKIDIYGAASFWNADNANNNGNGGGFTMNGTVT